jgi:hypothetical protein
MSVHVEPLEASCDCLEKIAERVCAEYGGRREGPMVLIRTRVPVGHANRSGTMAVPVTPVAFTFADDTDPFQDPFYVEPKFCQFCGAERQKRRKVKIGAVKVGPVKKRPGAALPPIDV